MVYAAMIYVISPWDLLPASIYHLLGVLDDGVAVSFVYKKISEKITDEIRAKVENTLNEWFDNGTYAFNPTVGSEVAYDVPKYVEPSWNEGDYELCPKKQWLEPSKEMARMPCSNC